MSALNTTLPLEPTVLIVDDNASNLRLAADCLEAGDMSVVVARDGGEALARASYVRPDLILLDVRLPGMDGFETCRRLKQAAETRDIPVVFMTALADTADKLAAFEAGGVDYVTKPVQAEELLARVKTHLALREARSQLQNRNAQLSTTFDNVEQGICFFDAEQRLIVSNHRYAEIYGLTPESVRPGMTLGDILELRDAVGSSPDMPREDYLAWFNSVNIDGGQQCWTTELRCGRFVQVRHRATADGGWVSTHEDVTEAKRAEKAVADARAEAERAEREAREAHLRLLDAFKVVPEGLALFDAEDRYVLWNERYQQIYAESGDNIAKGMRFEDTLRAGLKRGQYPQAVGREEEWLAERLARHAQASITHEQELPGGRWLRIHERRTTDGGSVGVRIDITDLKQRETSFRLLFESNPVPMWVHDRETLAFLDVNQAAVDHYGYAREQFLSMTLLDIRPPEERQALKEVLAIPDEQRDRCRSWRHLKADGSPIDVLVYSTRLGYQGRDASLASVVDITERKRAENELRTTREFLDTVIESVPVTVFVKDAASQRYLLVNKAGEEFVGLSRDQIVGKTVDDIFAPDIAAVLRRLDDQLLTVGGPEKIVGAPMEVPNKGQRIVNSSAIAIREDDGVPKYLLRVVEDVTEHREAEQRIAHLAMHDALTDLPNRAAFSERLETLLKESAAVRSQFALIYIDLDRFKEVNDVFGHNVGDEFLCQVAERLQRAVDGAFLARLGGDEFILLVDQGKQPAAATAMLDRILAALAEEVDIDGNRIKAGVSMGVAVYPVDGQSGSALLANADAALYRAKQEGRGRARFFEPEMDRQLREKRSLQRDLQAALSRRELHLHYQPQASIDGRILGFEALLRWQHPKRGAVSPTTFIPVAEESGVIMEIGEWTLREACREATNWSGGLHVAVNLSPIQFRHGDLPGLVHAILLETGLTPSRLELEITESVLIGDHARAIAILRRLKALGVGIAMDDFGTGYSSLSYLQSFPFDKIKIDQSFVMNVHQPQSAAIIRAVIGLGRGLHLPVTAEGVETDNQLAFLAAEGCEQVQGYLIGRPLPIEDYRSLVGHQAADARSTGTRRC
ncbi:EAL domain-containing protein [Allomesorhizobium camelthorni]|uniref:EAL domain-containing protein n=1 Tax=Allomesorhizobium camelthorni TaxID=475069 RepID=A0A6G4WA76_9HYPH|nr:EAL domain-containing protein [Mesorhizobium camelthorni]NGO51113.1 EAL domain-containing protein [Mesorhizobium camelthorni]